MYIRHQPVLAGLAIIATSLLIIDLVLQTIDWEMSPGWFLWPHIVQFFDMNRESSFPTWFSVSLLSGSAILTGIIAFDAWKRSRRYRWHWTTLTLLITGFSIDEGAQIHDSSTGTPLRDVIGTGGLLYYAWVIPAIISAVILAIFFARFVLDLPGRTRTLFLLSAGVFFSRRGWI